MSRQRAMPSAKCGNVQANHEATHAHGVVRGFIACVSMAALAFGVLESSMFQRDAPHVTVAARTDRPLLPDPAKWARSRPDRTPDHIKSTATVRVTEHASTPSWPKLFHASTDLRAFVAEARRDPVNGGDFYALRALAECRLQSLGQTPIELDPGTEFRTHTALQRRARLLDRSLRRCAAFLPEELGDDVSNVVEMEGRARGDPLIAAYDQWLEALDAGDYEHLVPALRLALERSDPQLLQSVAESGSVYWTAFSAPGASVDEPSMVRTLEAWRVVPCRVGHDCAAIDEQGQAACLDNGHCESDQVTTVFSAADRHGESESRLLAARVRLLFDAVQQRNAALLLGATTR